MDRKVIDLTWENIRVGAICQKVMGFLNFRKMKKLQKVTFAFLHTCTTFLLDLGGPKRKSAKSCTFCTLARPNRPSRTFSYVYDVFGCSESPKSTLGAFGAGLVKSRSPGARTLNRGGPPRGGGGGGGFPTLPLSSRTLLSLVDSPAPQPSPWLWR